MKKIILMGALLVSSLFADIRWVDMFDAYDTAKSEHKTVMVMLSQEGCPGCEYMKDIVFEDKSVSAKFNKNFLAVHLDIHNDFIPDYLTYFATPTLYFLTEDKKVLKKIVGAQKVKKFLKTLDSLERK